MRRKKKTITDYILKDIKEEELNEWEDNVEQNFPILKGYNDVSTTIRLIFIIALGPIFNTVTWIRKRRLD